MFEIPNVMILVWVCYFLGTSDIYWGTKCSDKGTWVKLVSSKQVYGRKATSRTRIKSSYAGLSRTRTNLTSFFPRPWGSLFTIRKRGLLENFLWAEVASI